MSRALAPKAQVHLFHPLHPSQSSWHLVTGLDRDDGNICIWKSVKDQGPSGIKDVVLHMASSFGVLVRRAAIRVSTKGSASASKYRSFSWRRPRCLVIPTLNIVALFAVLVGDLKFCKVCTMGSQF